MTSNGDYKEWQQLLSVLKPIISSCHGHQVLNAMSECIEKEGYSYVVEDDLQGHQGTDHAHTGPRRR